MPSAGRNANVACFDADYCRFARAREYGVGHDMQRIPDVTEIVFGKEFSIYVKETPEEILALLESWMSEPGQD